MSTLVEINELAATRPAADAKATDVASWYERKAVVLHRIADDTGSVSEHDMYEVLAQRAHEHAVRLLADQAHRHAIRLLALGRDL